MSRPRDLTCASRGCSGRQATIAKGDPRPVLRVAFLGEPLTARRSPTAVGRLRARQAPPEGTGAVSGPFALVAMELLQQRLAVIPLDGKVPLLEWKAGAARQAARRSPGRPAIPGREHRRLDRAFQRHRRRRRRPGPCRCDDPALRSDTARHGDPARRSSSLVSQQWRALRRLSPPGRRPRRRHQGRQQLDRGAALHRSGRPRQGPRLRFSAGSWKTCQACLSRAPAAFSTPHRASSQPARHRAPRTAQ